MIKQLVWMVSLVALLSSCGNGVAYQIEGKLSNLEDNTIYAVFENDNYKEVDTVTCEESGKFLIKRAEGDFNTVTIYFDDKKSWVTAYLEAGEKITVTGDVTMPSLLQIKGGRINNHLNDFSKKNRSLLEEQATLLKKMEDALDAVNTTSESDVHARLANVNHQLSELAVEYIHEHPDREASVVLMQQYFTNPNDTRRIDELLAILKPELRQFYLVEQLEAYSSKAQRTSLGAEAPEFTLKNIYGKSVTLASFPQRYLLLAFTAPWCDMCQTEDLLLDKVAMKYPKEQVDMLLISLDENSQEVRKLLENDSIDWNLVTDSAGQATQMVDLYNVNTLPHCFLIDEEGVIILKTDNGLEIEQTLEKLIDK